MALCEKCILKWLPENLRSGKMKWENLHPRVRAILVRNGYDRTGNKK